MLRYSHGFFFSFICFFAMSSAYVTARDFRIIPNYSYTQTQKNDSFAWFAIVFMTGAIAESQIGFLRIDCFDNLNKLKIRKHK